MAHRPRVADLVVGRSCGAFRRASTGQLPAMGLLVAPARVTHPAPWRRVWIAAVLLSLRTAAYVSQRFLAGRGRGFASVVAARLLGHHGTITFQLAGGGTYAVASSDRYWVEPLLLEKAYESDLDHFLHRCITPTDVFLDCGANLGLWSIATAQVIKDPRRVVAVEAGAQTFEGLQANAAANGGCFTARHRAVDHTSGDRISFFASARDHASATAVEDFAPHDAQREETESVSLLDLIAEHTNVGLVIVKLDIEGNECRALSAVPLERGGNLLILFEDHGRDSAHTPTRFLLERGWAVAFLHDDGSIERVRLENLERLTHLKQSPLLGYNLVAVAPSGRAAARLVDCYPDTSIAA
jgi:FkbM family methyltransferase